MSGFTETVSSTSVGVGGQVSESVLLELAELPDIECESVTHGDPKFAGFHSEGAATHYAQMRHACSGGQPLGTVYPVCAKLASSIRAREAEGRGGICVACGRRFKDAMDWVIVLGPVRRKKK